MENLIDITDDAMVNDIVPTNDNDKYQNKTSFDVKNYLDTKIPDGASEKTLRIRLLPFPETGSPFFHIHMHNIQVNKDVYKSGFKSYICLDKTEGFDKAPYGGKCPLCELNQKAYKAMLDAKDASEKEYNKRISLSFMPKPVVIMRCIERGKENEGVKFWKVNVRQDKGDAYNLIKTLYNNRKQEWLNEPENQGKDPKESNILSWREFGYDLLITFKSKEEVNQKTNKVEKRTSILVSDARKPSALSDDMEQIKKWIYDPKKWYEVFPPKHYDYLSLVAQGEVPFFDKNINKWVTRTEHNQEKENEIQEAERRIQQAQNDIVAAPTPANVPSENDAPAGVFEDGGGDLPF